jgi:chromosome segregation ATPase
MTTSGEDNVHELRPGRRKESDEQARQRLIQTIETLERRQGERRLFIAEIEHLYERRQREIENLKAQLEAMK